MALEVAFDEALRAFDALPGKGDIEFNPSTTNSDEWSCSQADGLPRNLQAGELAEARASYTPHVPTTPWQEVEPPPSNQQYHDHSCTPHKAINAHLACAKPVVSKSSLPHASSATLAPSKAGSCNKRSMSRTYSEMASSVDFPSEHQESVSSPSIDSTNMPPDTIEGARPRYRYATLIGMAILQSQKRCLTLAQIYKWISDNFAFYSLAKGGWQNSIRHSLTLNKKFIKIERPKDDPGKGSYWGIERGQEHTFVQDLDNARCSTMNRRTLQYIHTTIHQADCNFKVATTHATEQSTGASGLCEKTPSGASDSVEQSHEVVQPSNNKIAVVDSALQEQGIETAAIRPGLGPSRSSPYEQKRSSRIESPPHTLVHYLYETSVSCCQEDDGSLNNNDFGWPNEPPIRCIQPHLLTMKQGAECSQFRSGRAEAEIARIRSSHTTSPRYHTRAQSFRSSSSCRRDGVYASAPVVVFEDQILALPTLSPETNLRTHRKNTWGLLGSPASPFFSFSPSPSPSPSP